MLVGGKERNSDGGLSDLNLADPIKNKAHLVPLLERSLLPSSSSLAATTFHVTPGHMNGVRRFLGGGGSSTQPPPPPPPPPQPQPPPPVPAPDTPPPPPPASAKPSWPLQSSRPSTPTDAKSSSSGTPGLVIRKERSKPTQVTSPTNRVEKTPPRSVSTPASARSPTGSIASYNVASPTRRLVRNGSATLLGSPTPSCRAPPLGLPEPTPSESSVGWKRTSGLVNIRDELLMSLLTSEAVVDSRECEILSAEEVEELKKVRAMKLLPTRVDTPC